MHFLRALLEDYGEAHPDTDLGAAEAFIAWAESDLAAHPIGSTQVEVGRVIISREAPREDAELPVGSHPPASTMPMAVFGQDAIRASMAHRPPSMPMPGVQVFQGQPRHRI